MNTMLRKIVLFGVLIVGISCVTVTGGQGEGAASRAGVALAYESPGKPTGYVNDFAGVLSSDTKATLEASLDEFEKSTSNQISVVIIPNMKDKNGNEDYIENFAEKLFKEWGIGTAGRDNGVLLLVAMEERTVRIEVGYGLEGALTDLKSGRIVDGLIVPKFKNEDYAGGIVSGVDAIMGEIKGEYSVMDDPAANGEDDTSIGEIISFGFFIFLNILFAMGRALRSVGKSHRIWPGGAFGLFLAVLFGLIFWNGLIVFGGLVVLLGGGGLLLDFILSRAKFLEKWRSKDDSGSGGGWFFGGGRGGGSSGGGGFGGFGGGMSGGGGASGRW